MRYDITVLTLISHGAAPHVRDEITFHNVGDDVLDFVAGSCKATLFKLMKLPEDKGPFAWNLKYRTVVRKAGTAEVVSDTKLITFPGMDGPGIRMFQDWAIEQLRETAAVVNAEVINGPVATRRRNRFFTLIKLLLGRTSVDGGNGR